MIRWPDALPELGPRVVDFLTTCSRCTAGTFVRYAGAPFCFRCALALAGADHGTRTQQEVACDPQ